MNNPDAGWVYETISIAQVIGVGTEGIPLVRPNGGAWVGVFEILEILVFRTLGALAATFGPVLCDSGTNGNEQRRWTGPAAAGAATLVLGPSGLPIPYLILLDGTKVPTVFPQPNVLGDTFQTVVLVRKRL